MFDMLTIFIPFGTLILIAVLVRIRRGNWSVLLEKEYMSLVIVVPTLSLSILTLLFTRQVNDSQLRYAVEQKRVEFGRRKLQEQVTFKFNLVQRRDDVDLDLWYEKTPETLTPKNLRVILIPILMKKTSKENVGYGELRRANLIIEFEDEAVHFKNGQFQIPGVRRTMQENTRIRGYMESNKLELLGVGVEVCYNGIEGYLEPLKYFDIGIFPKGGLR